MIELTRREYLCATAAAAACSVLSEKALSADKQPSSLVGEIGITTGGLNYQREQGILTLMTLPKFVRDELGMRLIDLNTRWLKSYDETYVQDARATVDEAGCYVTNLKVNHPFGDLYSKDIEERGKAISSGRQMIKVAKLLGARWIRFSIAKSAIHHRLAAHRELAKFARESGLQLVVENGGWMKSEPDSIVNLVKVIGNDAAAAPDTGNWNDEVRYEALAKSCPGAVTCDFKVFDLDEQGRHEKYDIERCFQVAWKAGFRGPWAIEHWNEDTAALARETVFLRDKLRQWTRAAE